MNDEETLQIIRDADPLPTGICIEEPPRALVERVLASAGPGESTGAWSGRRKRLGLVTVALVVGALSAGLAIAGTGWLTGEPAPPAVVANFQAYTPELGFQPDPGAAVLAAQDGSISLFATTNQEGTYCFVLDEPWKAATTLDGGTCVPAEIASRHLIAGIVGGSSNEPDGHATLVVAGRSDNSAARMVRFTDPSGGTIERPVGSSGFFVAGVDVEVQPCADWTSTFAVLDANGAELAQTTLPLVQSEQSGRVCVFSPLHP